MSIFGTMKTSVSGMNAQGNRLGAVGDNIANSSTIGYKRASTAFSSMILPSSAGNYNSGGVSSNIRYSIAEQGGFTFTTSPTDMAIDGNGFFIVSESREPGAAQFLTRAGSFTRETVEEPANSGQYKTFLRNAAGFYLFAPAQATASNNQFPGAVVEIPSNDIKATPTTGGALQVVLDSKITDGNSWETSLVGYGYQGVPIEFEMSFLKTATGWDIKVTNRDTLAEATGSITIDPLTGERDGGDSEITFPADTATPPTHGDIIIDITKIKQLNTTSAILSGGLNGKGASSVTDVAINADGSIDLKYTDGSVIDSGNRIMIATVTSPDNLIPLSGNVYAASNTSGVLIANDPGTAGAGDLMVQALENSTVDIANELTEMIESQRIYTANSKVFQTGSELLEVLVNLKR
ncbi:flagellar hook protein FlgE [Pseudorhizobium flavum]|uniref:flagellar hook protein FlgE n=1 Tax=Pseudorhizobium flavum TaxID=1335061 RepID=UPI0024927E05|nr:flagellar hook protein FlgE [Pseudorhizobium flavum]